MAEKLADIYIFYSNMKSYNQHTLARNPPYQGRTYEYIGLVACNKNKKNAESSVRSYYISLVVAEK